MGSRYVEGGNSECDATRVKVVQWVVMGYLDTSIHVVEGGAFCRLPRY